MTVDIQKFILNALNRRHSINKQSVPSVYWSDFSKNFKYVYDLSLEELARIRFHTFHLTSDIYLTYYFANEAYRILLQDGYKYFIKLGQLQSVEEGPDGIGIDTEFGKISHDLLRYMGLTADLFNSGSLDRTNSKYVLEIGGGYGGLARMTILNAPKSSYFICDLEETIFFSATYLQNSFGLERVHLIDAPLSPTEVKGGHIYIVPQSRLEYFDDLHFDLAISQQSLQEMTADQVHRYCSWILDRADQFYSCNLPDHAQIAIDKELVQNLPIIFNSYFGSPEWVGDFPDDNSRYGDNHLPRALYHCCS